MASNFNISKSDNTRDDATMDDATVPKLAFGTEFKHTSISPPIHSGVLSSPSTASWPVSNQSSIQDLSRPSSVSSLSGSMSSLDLGLSPEPHAQGNKAVGQVRPILSSLSNALGEGYTRPFQCDVCAQSFNRNHDLKRHKQIHLPKPFTCSSCYKSFSRKDALKRHSIVKGCGEGSDVKILKQPIAEENNSDSSPVDPARSPVTLSQELPYEESQQPLSQLRTRVARRTVVYERTTTLPSPVDELTIKPENEQDMDWTYTKPTHETQEAYPWIGTPNTNHDDIVSQFS
ncbi:hypothetical protein M434DRAFT_282570 [Hypoxylon sp. CO27-5]|nr:hypothetical protein M434DRAFT_282570 [Hypoxylon sp. CO27-5]